MVIVDDEAAFEKQLGDADFVEHLERRRVNRSCARIVEDLVAAFEERERNAAPRQVESCREAYWPATCNQHPIHVTHTFRPRVQTAHRVTQACRRSETRRS